MDNLATGFRRYLQMRLRKLKVLQLAQRIRKPKSTVHDWSIGRSTPRLDDVVEAAKNLRCPEDVLVGRQPCLLRCPHCELSQP